MRSRLTQWWYGLVDALTPESDELPRVDTEYLLHERPEYRWMTVLREDKLVRCDICGEWMKVQKMPEMVEHVALHDDQGAAEVDPTEKADVTAHAEYSDLLLDDEVEPGAEVDE